MPERIEDYALIGDCHTAALVSRGGSIDWLCLPQFDSEACFAALLGGPEHGRWLVAPRDGRSRSTRAYRHGTLVLDTTFHTPGGGVVTVTDCMPRREETPHLVRQIRGVRGRVPMRTELIVRFDYGSVVPWVRRAPNGIRAVAGPHALRIASDVPLQGQNLTTVGEFEVVEGQTVSMSLTWHPSHTSEPREPDASAIVEKAETTWRAWADRCTYRGDWQPQVLRSLITLKALTHASTGGIVAAPTTSLPETIGGARNWDYRYCWVRDATFTLLALAAGGYNAEAREWREWLLRAVAGDPSKLQILYGVDGTRRIPEWEVDWLPGYEASAPVRVGNAASQQLQLDVYGELFDAIYQCHRAGMGPEKYAWDLQRVLLQYLESTWDQPDNGIWEVRGPRRHFTHSKIMAWVAFDRGIKSIERLGMSGPVEKWRALRDEIHRDVCRSGYDANLGTFVQYFGSKRLDASLLMIPLVGFLPATDARVRGTIRAVEQKLMDHGLVRRYQIDTDGAAIDGVDGLPGTDGVFLPCTFWLANNWALVGRHEDACRLFERLLCLANDVGLMSEEYDARTGAALGNYPQAFSHVALVNTASNLSLARKEPGRHCRET